MGQEIVYCSRCASRLMGSDFEKGKAFRLGDKSVCKDCAQELLEKVSGPERELLAEKLAEAGTRKRAALSSPPLPAPPGPSGAPGSPARSPMEDSSRKMRAIGMRPSPPPEQRRSLSPGLLVAILLIIFVGIIALASVLKSGPSAPRETPPPIPDRIESPVPPSPPPVLPTPGPAPVTPRPAPPPPSPAAVSTEAELDRIDKEVRTACEQEDFRRALEVLEVAKKQLRPGGWYGKIQERIQNVYDHSRKVFEPLREAALSARKKKDEAEVQKIVAQVAKWGLPTLSAELEKRLNPEAPPPPAVSRDALTSQASFLKALSAAGARDYEAALRELEATQKSLQDRELQGQIASDLDAFRQAMAVPQEAIQVLSKWPRGWNLAVAFWNESGAIQRLDEPVVRVEPTRVELRKDPAGGTVRIEIGEIAAATLSEIYRNRPGRRPEPDAKAAALFCLFEGELDAAREQKAGALPERYLALVQEAARLRATDTARSKREAEARKLYYEADAQHRGYGTRVASLALFQKLRSDYADTAFVRRNRASVEGRTEDAREYLFTPADLVGAGGFRVVRHADGHVSWTSEEDVPDKSRRSENYVELAYSALPDAEYRAWALIGACCQETFAFALQGTELQGGELGSKEGVAVPVTLPFLKKSHSLHGGKKEPTRWEWIPLPLPKSAPGGPKKLRLTTDQQGFSVAIALVSCLRKDPPRESELRELLKARPSFAVATLAPTGSGKILREVWTDVPGDTVATLTGHPKYQGKPDITSFEKQFEGPRDWADNYGTRMRGYLHPPATGNYVLWIASDDDSELWLGTSDAPSSKILVAYQQGAVAFRDWNAKPTQKSSPVTLVKGRRYYIEALQKEGGGPDHLSVGWQLPDGTMERPIPGNRLSPYVSGARGSLLVELTGPQSGAVFATPATISIFADAFGPAALSRAEVFQGSTKIGDARTNPVSFVWNNPPVGAWPLAIRVTDKTGASQTSPSVFVRVGELTFYRGLNLNGPPLTVDGNAWEGRDAPGYKPVGTGFDFQDMDLKPSADPDRAALIRSGIWSREGTSVTLTGVPPGTYQVYLYVWEVKETQTYDLLVRGKLAQSGYTSQVGRWDRLGPWTTEVSDGTLEVKAARGAAAFSGLEIWRVGK
jgi:hypothetical protein